MTYNTQGLVVRATYVWLWFVQVECGKFLAISIDSANRWHSESWNCRSITETELRSYLRLTKEADLLILGNKKLRVDLD